MSEPHGTCDIVDSGLEYSLFQKFCNIHNLSLTKHQEYVACGAELFGGQALMLISFVIYPF